MRSFLMFFAGVLLTGLIAFLSWVFSAGCPPGRMILSARLTPPLSAEVLAGKQTIWSGSFHATDTIRFTIPTQDSSFSVRWSDGREQPFGYLTPGLLEQHILFINDSGLQYGSRSPDMPEFLRWHAACLLD